MPKAVQMVGGTLDPKYSRTRRRSPTSSSPSSSCASTRASRGSHGIGHAFRLNPTAVFTTARFVVALLGTLSVGLVYWVGARFYERRVGLVAAVLMACAFLPVFYAKQALNDAVTLVPIAVALAACLFIYEDGRLRHWILAGAAVGVATDVKYTAAAMAAVVGLAGLLRVIEKRDTLKQFLKAGVVSAVAFGVLFVLLDPYMLVHLSLFKHQVAGEAGTAGGSAKLGQSSEPGWVYYLWTLSWGFGWLPTLAAVAGAGARAALEPCARPAARALPAAAARVPRRPGAPLRPLVSARLPGAGRARRLRRGAHRGRAAGELVAPQGRARGRGSRAARHSGAVVERARELGVRQDRHPHARAPVDRAHGAGGLGARGGAGGVPEGLPDGGQAGEALPPLPDQAAVPGLREEPHSRADRQLPGRGLLLGAGGELPARPRRQRQP